MAALNFLAKTLKHAFPSGYRRVELPKRPTLDAYVGVIDEILHTDKALIKKQRHTAKRIFERLAVWLPLSVVHVSPAGQ